ncbi:TPA: AAA family ATPase [Legionella pneumophila]|nr:AAA family ATPase [Legionella pneumophila]HAT1926510.1 AAA family ATPase [Legionella pneumophila]
MSNKPEKIHEYKTMNKLVTRVRDDLNDHHFVLLFAYNGIGKTRLSMAFKDEGKKNNGKDTLYFNAFTEDLFHWDNDLEGDSERYLSINSQSAFFSGFKELALEEKIFSFLERYADFDFKIDYDEWKIIFIRGEEQYIKVSRGEQNIFIWCIFLAIVRLVIDGHESYTWVKNIYIDDPISSLDDNNAIAVASDLAKLLKSGVDKIKAVISTHHGLFFNVLHNELKAKKYKSKTHFYHRANNSNTYTLRNTNDTPFFHHVATLSELKNAVESDQIYTYHFNMLRSIMEKTAVFFGAQDFSSCIHGIEDQALYARALNLLSHGQYSIYEPREMMEDNKELFKNIYFAFLDRYDFKLPEITQQQETQHD